MLRALALLFVLAVAPEAQPFLVESATPADYASGVPTETTVALTFSAPLGDLSDEATPAPAFVILPTDAATITATEQSEDRRT
ncbi:MAG: Ig-like domain-containing protein, partial [Bacteroidota bacterium]